MQYTLTIHGATCKRAVLHYLKQINQTLGLPVSAEEVLGSEPVAFAQAPPASTWMIQWPPVAEADDVSFAFETTVHEASVLPSYASRTTIQHYMRTVQALASNVEAAHDFLRHNTPGRRRTMSGTRSQTQPSQSEGR